LVATTFYARQTEWEAWLVGNFH